MSVIIRSILVLIALIIGTQNGHILSAQESATNTASPISSVDSPVDESIGAEAPAEFVSADIAWMLVCSALVLMMTAPGLALFYGGLVRKKNILSVMMQCIFLMGLMSIVWAAVGYSLAFGGTNPYFGNFDHIFLAGVTPSFVDGEIVTPATGTLPTSIFMCFQGMFFIITPALICGAFAERLKFSTMCIFMVLWGLLIFYNL